MKAALVLAIGLLNLSVVSAGGKDCIFRVPTSLRASTNPAPAKTLAPVQSSGVESRLQRP
ncbi:MAG: hypothetical protein WCH11_00665 [Bdellovibrio sp.]